jgi:hypothetical protein
MPESKTSTRPSPDHSADGYVAIDTTNMDLLGPPISPKERTHMPLSAAAHWIASEGGRISITADETWWRPAFQKLISKIVLGVLAVNGRRGGLPEAVLSDLFVGIPVAYPGSNSPQLWIGDEPYLECLLFVDEADWHRSGGDKLFRSGREPCAEWTHLQMPSSAIARLWPFRLRRTVHDEKIATEALAKLLCEQPHLTRAGARQQCEEYKLGRVAFNRAWRKARKINGLPERAPPGRPRKSRR